MNSLLDSNNTQVVEIEEIYVVSPSDMFCIKYMARIGFFFNVKSFYILVYTTICPGNTVNFVK